MYFPQFRNGIRTTAKSHYGNLFNDRYVVMRYKINFEFVKKLITTNKRKIIVLDVGGYTADNLEYWKRMGINTKLIEYKVADFDIEAGQTVIKRGGKFNYYDFNINDLTKLYPRKKFDLIICTEVLEHLLDPQRQMEFFKKLLKANGRVLISLPNENTIFHRIYSLLGYGIDRYPFALYKHLHFPNLRQSKDFVSNYFKIVKYKYNYNFNGTGSKFKFFEGIFAIIPDAIWEFLVNQFPSLLARGTIFYLKKK